MDAFESLFCLSRGFCEEFSFLSSSDFQFRLAIRRRYIQDVYKLLCLMLVLYTPLKSSWHKIFKFSGLVASLSNRFYCLFVLSPAYLFDLSLGVFFMVVMYSTCNLGGQDICSAVFSANSLRIGLFCYYFFQRVSERTETSFAKRRRLGAFSLHLVAILIWWKTFNFCLFFCSQTLTIIFSEIKLKR